MSESNFEDDGMNGDILILMARIEESLFPLDILVMRSTQLNNEQL